MYVGGRLEGRMEYVLCRLTLLRVWTVFGLPAKCSVAKAVRVRRKEEASSKINSLLASSGRLFPQPINRPGYKAAMLSIKYR